MLTFVTGNPGNGKSLWTVTTIEAMRVKENREVFQDGIEELVYPWKTLPVERRKEQRKRGTVEVLAVKWEQVPDGAIVVIDEAWRVFPLRSQGSAVPDYVQFLATHRHHGLDIFLATQQVKTQVDSFVRGLAGKHVHLDRKFGMEYAVKYEWERTADPSSSKDVALAQTGRFIFPKEQYGNYKSAVVHTHKRSLPYKKILILVGCLVGAFAAFWYAFSSFGGHKKVETVDSSGRPSGQASAPLLTDFWVKGRIARVAGVPASAPIYDDLQRVRSQPRPEGCMQLSVGLAVRCTCTGPNHSELQISVTQCLDLVKRGWFDETRKYDDPKVANIAQLNGGANSAAGKDEKSSL